MSITRIPLGSLRRLESVAMGNYESCKTVLAIYSLVLGTTVPSFQEVYEARVGVVARLPLRERRAAEAILRWGARDRVNVTELLFSQKRVADELQRLTARSAYGRRRRRIARTLREQYPPQKPQSQPTSERPQLLEVLHTEVGRPVGPETIRQVMGFQPSQIEIRARGEPWYALVTKGAAYIQLAADAFSVEAIYLGAVCASASSRRERAIYGVLEDFFETGTEGVVWSVVDEDARGYDALHPIDEGDHLTITDQLGQRLWSGEIKCDRKVGWRQYPLNPKYGQPCALGYWIHWTQEGFSPDAWAKFFIRPRHARLRGILEKRRADPKRVPK